MLFEDLNDKNNLIINTYYHTRVNFLRWFLEDWFCLKMFFNTQSLNENSSVHILVHFHIILVEYCILYCSLKLNRLDKIRLCIISTFNLQFTF